MENLGIDVKLILAQITSFAIFYFVFSKYISKPFIKYLEKQREQDKIREQVSANLEKRNAELAEKDKKADAERKKALDLAIKKSKQEASEISDQLVIEAKKEAEKILSQAKSQITEEREAMMKDVKKHITELSMIVVEKALKDYLTPQAQKDVTAHIIKQVPKVS
jgi:F-type H+-transporting ATPase subunit b